VYSKTSEEYAPHLRASLEVLRKNKLYAEVKKCEFWLEKVAFLAIYCWRRECQQTHKRQRQSPIGQYQRTLQRCEVS